MKRDDFLTKNNNIKLIAFDLGYTLVFNAREEYYLRYLEKHQIDIPRDKINLAFHHTDKLFMRYYIGALGKAPEHFLPWYLGIVNYKLDISFDLNDQSRFFLDQTDMRSYWQLFSWSKKVLKTLLERGYELALLSNWDESCRELIKDLEIYDYFNYVIISSEVGIEKPDKRIFEWLLSQTGYHPEEILYVGDNYYDDVVGSRKVGIETILINRFGQIGIEEIDDCEVIASTEELLHILEDKEVMTKLFN